MNSHRDDYIINFFQGLPDDSEPLKSAAHCDGTDNNILAIVPPRLLVIPYVQFYFYIFVMMLQYLALASRDAMSEAMSKHPALSFNYFFIQGDKSQNNSVIAPPDHIKANSFSLKASLYRNKPHKK